MRKGNYNKTLGALGEDAAVAYLKKNKYKIIKRNYRNKMGEIDIIAKEKNDLVFVEVKTRSSVSYGTPAEAVTYYKRQNIVNTAKWYVADNNVEFDIRFDVIEVMANYTDGFFELEDINHIKSAFVEV